MDKSLKKTIIGLVIISLVVFITGQILFNTTFTKWYFWFFPGLILLFLLINTAFFIFFHKALKKSGAHFIRSFMATTVVKLVFYMILILAYVWSSPKSAIPFAITLSVLYIIYSAYDLFVILGLLKRKKENTSLPNQFSN